MERPPKYQPVSADEEADILRQLEEEKDGIAWNNDSTEIIPTNTRSFVAFMSLLLISLSANVLLVMDNAKLRILTDGMGKTPYSSLTFDTPILYEPISQFWNPNISTHEMDAAWDAIDTSPMAVALHDDFTKKVGLPPSGRFPWDTERSIYYLKGIHDLHCVKFIRKAIVSKHSGDNQSFNLNHINHCLNGLRQDIMCAADDTPMPALTGHIGDGQVRKCRDWNKMTRWATQPDRHACYKINDYREATNTLEQFAFCPPNSPYQPIQQAYFDYHGHKDPYELKDEEEVIAF
ncbi:uncharacterized protein EKO05_0010958 [Ascochyta rabiei]|uniref:Uncharacterized protein n=1 Tax=Didymella rabiei TaxID=5454 RepID=A0A162ZJK8_DIDRA|nr:uncharacterized protein EKO05_0010958 [Ascochyta rabiei]KZM20640.1 hypothetical protein ST47_g8282 [Ascochyta rabiei]UPX20735.1 hypothetical protein EKO05_0010958 [Ascochyta rabiei]